MDKTEGSNRVKKILILVVILFLPGFLYYLLEKSGENRYKPLPIYGDKQLTGTFTNKMGKQIPDTLFHQIAPFTLTNQEDHPVSVFPGDTSITVVNFFYTRCETFCTHMNDEMNRVAERFTKNKMVNFYTISVDSLYDRPDVLKEYAQSYTLSGKNWHFLTAGPDDPMRIARDGFLVDALQDTTREGTRFIHSSSLILVDSHRRIRGYYDVNHRKEVDRLIDEIKLLLVQEIRETSPY